MLHVKLPCLRHCPASAPERASSTITRRQSKLTISGKVAPLLSSAKLAQALRIGTFTLNLAVIRRRKKRSHAK